MKKKLISLGMVLVLLLQLLPTSAFAAHDYYPYYVAIGDSVTYGYGLDDLMEYDATKHMHAIYNSNLLSYPKLVADALQQVKTGNENATAGTGQYANLGLLAAQIADIAQVFGGEYSQWGDQSKLQEEVRNADFVTLAVGSNDVTFGLMMEALKDINWESIDWGDPESQVLETLLANVNPLILLSLAIILMGILEVDVTEILGMLTGSEGTESGTQENAVVSQELAEVLAEGEGEGEGEGGGILEQLLGSITQEQLEEFLAFIDTDNLAEMMKAATVDANKKYTTAIETLRELMKKDAQLALVGTVNPYGNTVEYKGTRYTKAQIIATIISEVTRLAMEAAWGGVTGGLLKSELPMQSVEGAEVVAPAFELNIDAALEKSKDAFEQVANGEEFAFNAEEYAGEEKPALLMKDVAAVSEDAEVVSEQDEVLNGLLYGLVYHMLGVPTQQGLNALDWEAKTAVDEWNKANNSDNVSFIYVMDKVSKVNPAEGEVGVPTNKLLSAHPAEYGHRMIADAIIAELISTVTYDSNLAAAGSVDYNGDKPDQKQAILGSDLVLTIPTTVGNNNSKVDFVVVNNQRVWDRTWGRGNTVSVKITGPDTFVYAHCSGDDVLPVLTKTDADADDLTVIGDSIAAGFSLANNITVGFTPDKSYADCYPTYVAAELEKTLHNLGKPACNTAELLTIFGRTDARCIAAIESANGSYVYGGLLRPIKTIYEDVLAKSDTVVLHVGANDFMEETVGYMMNAIGITATTDIPNLLLAVTNLTEGKLLRLTPSQIGELLKSINGMPKLTDLELSALELAMNKMAFYNAYDVFSKNNEYNNTRVMAEMDKRLGADVAKVCLGAYDPIPTTLDTEDLPMGTIVKDAMGAANDYLEDLCKAYGWKYVDTDGVETGMSTGGIDPHPTVKGHHDIAEWIIEALGTPTPTSGNGGSGSGSVTTVSTGTAVSVEPVDEVCADFTDVALDLWSHEGIHYCLENSLMKGVGDNAFAPAATTTRGMIVTMLARLSGAKCDATGAQWYLPGQEWAVANGVSDGTMMTSNITREQLAAMLYRYAVEIAKVDTAKFTADTNTLSYEDVFTVSDWASAGVHFCLASGVIGGYEDGTIRPQGEATRAEVAAMFMRFCENVLAK